MSGIDDIDDEVTISVPKPTTLNVNPLQPEAPKDIPQQPIDEPVDPTKSSIFSRIKKRVDDAQSYLPKTLSDQFPLPEPQVTDVTYTLAPVNSISPKQLDIIRLTAVYTALFGRDFINTLTHTHRGDPTFGFLTHTHYHSMYFRDLTTIYKKIIDNIKSKSIPYILTCLGISSSSVYISLLSHAQQAHKDKLQILQDELDQQADMEVMAAIDWCRFTLVDPIITFPEDENVTLARPTMTLDDVELLFKSQNAKMSFDDDIDNIDEDDIGGRDMIDDIDDDTSSSRYISQSRALLRSNNDKHILFHDDNDDHITAATTSTTTTANTTTTNDDHGSLLDSLVSSKPSYGASDMTKCDICGQLIPITEFTEHVKLELMSADHNSNGSGTTATHLTAFNQRMRDSVSIGAADLEANLTRHLAPPSQQQQQQQNKKSTVKKLNPSTFESASQSHAPTPITIEQVHGQHQRFINQQNQQGGYNNISGSSSSSSTFSVPLPPLAGLSIGSGPTTNTIIGTATPLPLAPPVHEIGGAGGMPGAKRPRLNDPSSIHAAAALAQLGQSGAQTIVWSTGQNNATTINATLVQIHSETLIEGCVSAALWYREHPNPNGTIHVEIVDVPELHDDGFNGQTISIVYPTLAITIGDLKNAICQGYLNGYATKNIKINIANAALFLNKNDASLAAYNLKDGSVLQLKLRGKPVKKS